MSRISARLLASAAVAIACMTPVSSGAEGVSPSLFQDLHWRSIGPFRGGRVLAVAGAPDNAQRFYFGSVNGGVWRTEDAGRTWSPIFDGQPVGSIGALAVAPSAPNTLYVGTGESDMRSDIAQGIGMFRSTDGGASWSAIGLADTQAIARIVVDPRDANVLLVAALGHPYGPNDERGVFRSTDGGKTWAKTLFRNADTGAIDLVAQPGNPDVVYAALWQTRRPPWNVYPPSNGPGGGVFKSLDGGKTWAEIKGHGLPGGITGRIGLTISAANPKRVFALVDAEEGGLFRSDDAGETWARVSADKRIRERAWYFSEITADPNNADRLWVNDTIVLRSDDGGAHFIAQKGDPTGDDFHAMWIDPKNSDRQILGVDQGALVTLNGGKSWSSWFNQPTGQFYHVATDNRFPYRVYGAQQDSGAAGVSSRADNAIDGINMTHFHEVTAGGESGEIAPDPDDPDTVFGGKVDRLDLKSGQSRNVDPTLAYPDNYRSEWTLPLVFGKRNHDLYFGNQRIFKTSDNGEHWTPISPDLTRTTLTVPPNLDPVTALDTEEKGPRRGVVYDIGPSALKDGLIWAGTDDGMVWKTRDGGGHWEDVTPAGLKPWSKIGVIEPSHFDADTAYIAVDRHRVDDFAPWVYRTRDGGRSWKQITLGLAEDGVLNAVNVVREDPAQKGLLYAGTERGAFVSFDDGDHWQPLQSGLPRTSVRDITVHEADLVIATHGRGFYIMDNVTPLRALGTDAKAGPRLLPLTPAIRIHEPLFLGTPMPRDEPMAPNPPDGAYIDYVVGPVAAKSVKISVFDSKGELVKSFTNGPPPPKLDAAFLPVAPEWVEMAMKAPPSAAPGQHRFVWDLRYAAKPELGGNPFSSGAVWATPGAYLVELNIDGVVLRQPLQIKADPRVKVTQGQFEAQFAMSRQVEAARVSQRKALAAAKSGSMTAIVAQLTETGEQLDKLAEVLDAADAAPTTDAKVAFDNADKALKAALAQLDAAPKTPAK